MDREDKIEYLNRFKEAYERYEYLKSEVDGLKSLDFTYIRSTKHKTLIDKIYERDRTYDDMIKIRDEIESICHGNTFLRYHFILMKSKKEMAVILGYSIPTVRKKLNKALDDLEI